MEQKKYPCISCGCCCSRIAQVVNNLGCVDKESLYYFPYDWDESGKCKKLTDENKCSVYENRPLICNVNAIADHFLIFNIESWHQANLAACELMRKQDNKQ